MKLWTLMGDLWGGSFNGWTREQEMRRENKTVRSWQHLSYKSEERGENLERGWPEQHDYEHRWDLHLFADWDERANREAGNLEWWGPWDRAVSWGSKLASWAGVCFTGRIRRRNRIRMELQAYSRQVGKTLRSRETRFTSLLKSGWPSSPVIPSRKKLHFQWR